MTEETATTTIRISPSTKERLEEEKKRRYGEVAKRVSYNDVISALLQDSHREPEAERKKRAK